MDVSTPDHSFNLVIVAAGRGKRFQGARPKQYQALNTSYTIVEYTLKNFLPVWERFNKHFLVVQPEHEQYWHPFLQKKKYPDLEVVYGGEERFQSVQNALEKCLNTASYVLIHDAVRPFASAALIEKIMKNTIQYGACIPALPIRDTVKEIDATNFVTTTLNRDRLRLIQTPQGFDTPVLYDAMKKNDQYACSDEAAYLERTNQPVKVIDGEYTNIKVTYPEDLLWAQYYADKKNS